MDDEALVAAIENTNFDNVILDITNSYRDDNPLDNTDITYGPD